jgi:hypothetical protein
MSTVDLIVPLASFSLLAALLLTRAIRILGLALELAIEALRFAVRAIIAILLIVAMAVVLGAIVASRV